MKELIVVISTTLSSGEDVNEVKAPIINLGRWHIDNEEILDTTQLRDVCIEFPSATTNDIHWLRHLVKEGFAKDFQLLGKRLLLFDINTNEGDDIRSRVLESVINLIPSYLIQGAVVLVGNVIVD